MKRILVLILLLVSFVFLGSGCLNNGPILSLTNVEWYTTNEQIGSLTFGYVHLNLSGTTTGDKVTVMTYGDGLIGELELDLDQDHKFSQDVIIQFTHDATAVGNTPQIYSTVLTAYQGNYSTKINLESQELAYLE